MTNVLITILLQVFSFIPPTEAPPGTIRIASYYVDKAELSNVNWLEYLYFMGIERDSLGFIQVLPDTANFWFRDVERRHEPITLISYEQAIDYCDWRSKVVSQASGRKVVYRLPTPTEWRTIAEEVFRRDKKRLERESKAAKRAIERNSGVYFLFSREGLNQANRIYDLFMNVSEMTSEKGLAVGASNLEIDDLETNLSRIIHYEKPNPYLGFRCIAEWLE